MSTNIGYRDLSALFDREGLDPPSKEEFEDLGLAKDSWLDLIDLLPGGAGAKVAGAALGGLGGFMGRASKVMESLTDRKVPGETFTATGKTLSKLYEDAITATSRWTDGVRPSTARGAFPVAKRTSKIPGGGWAKGVLSRDVDVKSTLGRLKAGGRITSSTERALVSRVAREIHGESTIATRKAVLDTLKKELGKDHDLSTPAKVTDYLSAMMKSSAVGAKVTPYKRTLTEDGGIDLVGDGIESFVDKAFRAGMDDIGKAMHGTATGSAAKGAFLGATGFGAASELTGGEAKASDTPEIERLKREYPELSSELGRFGVSSSEYTPTDSSSTGDFAGIATITARDVIPSPADISGVEWVGIPQWGGGSNSERYTRSTGFGIMSDRAMRRAEGGDATYKIKDGPTGHGFIPRYPGFEDVGPIKYWKVSARHTPEMIRKWGVKSLPELSKSVDGKGGGIPITKPDYITPKAWVDDLPLKPIPRLEAERKAAEEKVKRDAEDAIYRASDEYYDRLPYWEKDKLKAEGDPRALAAEYTGEPDWDAYAKGMEARYLSGEMGIEPLGRGADGYVWDGMPGTSTYTGSIPTLVSKVTKASHPGAEGLYADTLSPEDLAAIMEGGEFSESDRKERPGDIGKFLKDAKSEAEVRRAWEDWADYGTPTDGSSDTIVVDPTTGVDILYDGSTPVLDMIGPGASGTFGDKMSAEAFSRPDMELDAATRAMIDADMASGMVPEVASSAGMVKGPGDVWEYVPKGVAEAEFRPSGLARFGLGAGSLGAGLMTTATPISPSSYIEGERGSPRIPAAHHGPVWPEFIPSSPFGAWKETYIPTAEELEFMSSGEFKMPGFDPFGTPLGPDPFGTPLGPDPFGAPLLPSPLMMP